MTNPDESETRAQHLSMLREWQADIVADLIAWLDFEKARQDEFSKVKNWHTALIAGLTRHLDLDAGLREVLLGSRHEALVQGIAYELDLDAGLAAIVGPHAASNPMLAHGQARSHVTGPVVDLVAALLPAPRVALRDHPVLSTSELALVSHNARTVADDIDKVITEVNSTRRRNDVADLADLPLKLHGVLTRQSSPTRMGALAAGLEATGARLDDHTASLALAANLDNITWNPRAGLLAMTGIPARARAFAYTTQQIFSRQVDLVLERRERRHQPDALERALHATPSADQATAIIWLRDTLDDLTDLDLRAANLSTVPLDGIRWSPQTCWPTEWIDWVEQHSRLATDHSEVFVITGDPVRPNTTEILQQENQPICPSLQSPDSNPHDPP